MKKKKEEYLSRPIVAVQIRGMPSTVNTPGTQTTDKGIGGK